MNEHSRTQAVLYEFVKNELPDETRKQLERHLAQCAQCRDELKSLRAALEEIDRATVDWSAKQPSEYWTTFANSVQSRLNNDPKRKHTFIERFTLWVDSLTIFQPRDIAIAGALCAVALCALILGKEFFIKQQPPVPQQAARTSFSSVDSDYVRLHEYFRRSRALLVGLANMKTETDEPVDIGIEREISRKLLHETRMLKQRPLDSRSERLINDMEKIFLKVANAEAYYDPPQVEIIRGGIERVNLLYKIRRAESVFKSPNVMYANYPATKESQ